jgi:hypothetical protein
MKIENPKHQWLYKTSKIIHEFVFWIDDKFEIEEANPKSLKYRILSPVSCFIHDSIALELENLYYTVNGVFMNFDENRPITFSEYVRLFYIRRPIKCMKDFIMYKVLWFKRVDPHMGCPSYPMCDEDPMGCIIEQGIDNVEWYGHRD